MKLKALQRQDIVEQLGKFDISEGPNGESLQKMDYQSLRSLLALQKAVKS